MATTTDIAESLTIEDIPVKLRCASCNQLAQEAVRLPCCDQNICADCQSNKIENTCPICYHEPIDPQDCRPNKALRQTIKVFLKRKILDRENAKKQEAIQKAAAATPANAATPQVETTSDITTQASISGQGQSSTEARDTPIDPSEKALKPSAVKDSAASNVYQDSNKDVPQPSVESPGPRSPPRRESTITLENGGNHERTGEEEDSSDVQATNLMQQQMQQQNSGSAVQNMGNFGFDASALNFNGMDMTQMMQMMQNGMTNPMMAGFPNMMGVSGMGMDPMNMFNNFGGANMMNGMNMGMSFDAGQGAFGGFNGQQQGSWNSGSQNKFNQNDFGAGNFGPNAGYGAGYNMQSHQGNFNQMHQANYSQNDFQQPGYHNQGFHRGRGRGRGGPPFSFRGRGNYHQVNQGYHANNTQSSQQVPQAPQGPVRRGSPVYAPMNGENAENARASQPPEQPEKDEFAPGDADDREEEQGGSKPNGGIVNNIQSSENHQEDDRIDGQGDVEPDKTGADGKEEAESDRAHQSELRSPAAVQETKAPVPSATSVAMPPPPSPSVPTGPSRTLSREDALTTIPQGPSTENLNVRGNQAHGLGLQGRGFTRIPNGEAHKAYPPSEPKGLGVAGAPTGPKAMRHGPQTAMNKSEPGFSIVGRASADRVHADASAKSPTHPQSRSRSRHRSSRHRHHRDRSRSPAEEHGDERERERRRKHSRKYDDEKEESSGYKRHKSSRTRDPSLESSSRRSSHRGHRERDYDKEKDRSHRSHRYERDDEDQYKKSSRHHSQSPDRDMIINGSSKPHKSSSLHSRRPHDKASDDHPTSSSSSKRRRSYDEHDENLDEVDYDRQYRHDRSKRSKRSKHHDEQDEPSNHNSKSKHNNGTRNLQTPTEPSIPTGPRASKTAKPDLHAEERERRDRERQMKEIQRRALAGGDPRSSRRTSESGADGSKHGSDAGIRINGAATRKGARKISVKYEDELDDLRR